MILKSDRFQTIYRVTQKCGTTSFYEAILNWHGFKPGGPPRVYLRHNRREIAKTGLIEENVQSENLESYYDRHSLQTINTDISGRKDRQGLSLLAKSGSDKISVIIL